MAPWQVLRGNRVSRATQGYCVHHGSGGSVQYSTDTATAPSDGSSRSFYLSREKINLQQLNRRLASYLQQVQSLEAANQQLEHQIQQELDKKCPKELRQLDGHLRTVSMLQEQISERISTQAHLKLQLLTLELCSVDLKNRSEKERERRSHLEAALEDLRLLGVELQVHKLPELQRLADAHAQQLALLQIQHQQDVQGLLSEGSGGVAMEVQPVQSSDLRQQLDNVRQTSVIPFDKNQNEPWLNTQVPALTSDPAEASEVIWAELEELRGTAVSLEEELAQLHALNGLLEVSVREKNDSIMEQLQQLQHRADGLCGDLDSVLQVRARQDADHQALLGIKRRLEAEIHEYKRLLDGLCCQGVSEPAATPSLPPSGFKWHDTVNYEKANHHLVSVFSCTDKQQPLISEKVTKVQSLKNLSNMAPEIDRTGASADWMERESMATSTTVSGWSKSIVDEVEIKGQFWQNSLISDAQISHNDQHVYQDTIIASSETEMKSITTPDIHSPRSADILPTPENIMAETEKETMTNIKSEIIKSISGTEVKQEQDFGAEIATSDPTTCAGEDTVAEDAPLDPNDDSLGDENQDPADVHDALIASFHLAESKISRAEEDHVEVLEEFKMQDEKDKDKILEREEEGGGGFHIIKFEEDQDEVLDELSILEGRDKDQQLKREEQVEVGSHICKSEMVQDEDSDVLSILEETEKDQQLVKEEEIEVESDTPKSERDHDEVYEELKIQDENYEYKNLKNEEGEAETDICGSERDPEEVLDELNILGEDDQQLEKGDVVDESNVCGFKSHPDEVSEELSILDKKDKGQQLEKEEDLGIELDICGSERDQDEVCVDRTDMDQQLEKREVGVQLKDDHVFMSGQTSSSAEVEVNAVSSIPATLFCSPEVNDDYAPDNLTAETLKIVEIEMNDSEAVSDFHSTDDSKNNMDHTAEIILIEGPKQSSRTKTEMSIDSGVVLSSSDNEELLSPREVDVFLSPTAPLPCPIETEPLMSTTNHHFCPVSLEDNVGSPDSPVSPDDPDRYLIPTDLEKCPSPNFEDEDDEACLNITEASPASVKPVEKYTLSTKEESQSLAFGEVGALPKESKNSNVTTAVNNGDSLCFGSLGSTEKSGVTHSGFSSANSEKNILEDKEKQLGFGGLYRTSNTGHTSVGLANKGNNETSLSGTCQPKMGRFGSGGSGEWMVSGGSVRRKSSSISIPGTGSEDGPSLSPRMATSPSGTGRFSSGRSMEWMVYGGGLGHTSVNLSNAGTKESPSAARPLATSPSGQRLGRVGSMEWMVSGNKMVRSNSLHNTNGDEHAAAPPLATSPPDTGRFGRGEWRVYGKSCRRGSSLDGSSSRAEAKESPPVPSQLPTSPPITPRAGRFGSTGSGEWRVYGGSTERLSRSSSNDRVSVAAKASQVISPPGSLSGPRLSSSGGSGRYSTKPAGVVRRSSSVGSGGRLSSAGGGGSRLSCSSGTSGNSGRFTSSSTERKTVYSSASGRRSSVGSGTRAAGGSTPRAHRAPSPGGSFSSSGGSGGWLSISTAGSNRISGPGHGPKPSTEGRVITSSNRPIRSTGSGAGANKERISVCKMAALSISRAGRERSQDRQSQAQMSQQKNASAVAPLIQRWLTTDVGAPSGDGSDHMTRH